MEEQHELETKELENMIDRTISTSVGHVSSVVEAWARRNERLERARKDAPARGEDTDQAPQLVDQPDHPAAATVQQRTAQDQPQENRQRSAYGTLADKARQLQEKIRTQLAKDQSGDDANRPVTRHQEGRSLVGGSDLDDADDLDFLDQLRQDDRSAANDAAAADGRDLNPPPGPSDRTDSIDSSPELNHAASWTVAPQPDAPQPEFEDRDNGAVASGLKLADKYADRNVHAAELGDIFADFLREQGLKEIPWSSYEQRNLESGYAGMTPGRVGHFFRKQAEPSVILDQLTQSHASAEPNKIGKLLDEYMADWGLNPDELLTKPREESLALIAESRTAYNASLLAETSPSDELYYRHRIHPNGLLEELAQSLTRKRPYPLGELVENLVSTEWGLNPTELITMPHQEALAALRTARHGRPEPGSGAADRSDTDSQRVNTLSRQAKAADNSQAPPRAERIDQANSSPASEPATVVVTGNPTNPSKAATTNARHGTRSKSRGQGSQMQRERQKGQNRGR